MTIYIHTNTYIHTHIHTHIRANIHINKNTYTYIHEYIHTYIHTYIYTYIHAYSLVDGKYDAVTGTWCIQRMISLGNTASCVHRSSLCISTKMPYVIEI